VESFGKGPGTKVAPDRHTPARPLPCHTGAQFEHAETMAGCHGVPLARLIVITGLAGGRPHAGTEAGSRCSGPGGAACRTRQVDWPSPDDGHDQGGQLAEVIPMPIFDPSRKLTTVVTCAPRQDGEPSGQDTRTTERRLRPAASCAA
jgi:hypothetical protein